MSRMFFTTSVAPATAAPTPAGASSSASRDEWHNVTATEPRHSAPSAPTTLQSALEALPAGITSRGERNRNRRGRRRDQIELSTARSNDAVIPWYKRPSTYQEFKTVQCVFSSSLATSSTTVPVFGALSFNVGATNSFSAGFSAVFDEYRIDMIEVFIQPVGLTEITNNANYGQFVSVIDIDDAGTPSSLADLCDYNSAVVSNCTVGHYHRWKPTYAVATYQGAFTAYSVGTGFIDCAYPSVQHYGIKYGLGLSPAAAVNYEYQVRYHITYRAIH